MLNISAEELGKYKPHYKKSKKRRKNAPKHSKIGPLILLFKVPFYKLGKKKLML